MRLILTRHAKSSWDDITLRDHERPLNERGIDAAIKIGSWLSRHGYVPKLVLCSSAVRTRETWKQVSAYFPKPNQTIFMHELYRANWKQMFEYLTYAHASPIMMIGHNPSTAELAHQLVRSTPLHHQFFRYPTAATLVCKFPTSSWAKVTPGSGEVLDFVIPRELDQV